jgi:hypothetical protein
MEQEQKTHILIVPGQNGMGGQNVTTVLPYFKQHPQQAHNVETPLKLPDFGQSKCQNYLKDKINELKKDNILHDNDALIIHGSSQGTATTINFTAHNPNNIKALILESVLLTGNSAIFHTVDNVMMPEEYDLPESSYYVLPYTAKVVYPSYAPTGEQPINNIDKLPTDLPIIILHDDQDFQLNFKDAQALYAYLTNIKKNKNVYLFTYKTEKGRHINLLQAYDIEKISAINTILELHNILPFDSQKTCSLDDLKKYQPEVQQEWLDHFNGIFNKEQNLECLDISTKVVGSSLGLYTLSKWLGM